MVLKSTLVLYYRVLWLMTCFPVFRKAKKSSVQDAKIASFVCPVFLRRLLLVFDIGVTYLALTGAFL